MKKEVIVEGKKFTFSFVDEGGGYWYLGKNQFDLFELGYTTDITFYEVNSNWDDFLSFLEYISKASFNVHSKIEESNSNLGSVFKESYECIGLNIDGVYFTLGNINFLGKSPNFSYVLSFFVESESDTSFYTTDCWNVYFYGSDIVKVIKE